MSNLTRASLVASILLSTPVFAGDLHEKCSDHVNGSQTNLIDKHGDTPLHSVAFKGNEDAAIKFLAANADPNARDNFGLAPLHCAAERGLLKLVSELINVYKVDVNAVDINGISALHRASRNGHVEIIRILVNSKAAIDAQTKHGWTSLHIAAFNGEVDIVKLLRELGADVKATDQKGNAPLHIAAQKLHQKVVDDLVLHGANVTALNKKGKTPLQIVKEKTLIAPLPHQEKE